MAATVVVAVALPAELVWVRRDASARDFGPLPRGVFQPYRSSMTRCRVVRGAISALTVAAIVASCGGSDSGGDDAALGTAETATESDASTEATTETDAPESSDAAESSDAGDESAGETQNCDAIFSTAEMEEFFAEPVELTEETNDDLGQLVCTWESIEDPDDLEDLAFQLLVLQFYSGSPIEASAFFDPTMLESVTTIEDIGDLAYTSGSAGMDYYFVDEPVGGSLSYMETDMGNTDAPPLHTSEDVEELFRTYHDRVT
jgi:hypothetical protein